MDKQAPIKLPDSYIQIVSEIHKNLSKTALELASVRKVFLQKEETLFKQMDEINNSLVSNINIMAKQLGVPDGWSFNPELMSFVPGP